MDSIPAINAVTPCARSQKSPWGKSRSPQEVRARFERAYYLQPFVEKQLIFTKTTLNGVEVWRLKALAVVLVVALGLSLLFAVLAWSTPVKSLQPAPTCNSMVGTLAQGLQCDATWIAWRHARTVDMPIYQTYLSYVEPAEGLAIVALFCLIILGLKAPQFLKRRLALPKPLKLGMMLALVVGFGVFAYAEVFDILNAYSNSPYSILHAENSLFHHLFYGFDSQLPFHAVLGLAVASICFGLLRARKGLVEGIRSTFVFGMFWIFIAMLCISIFDYGEIYLQVALFTEGWVLFGFPILSNLSLLIISSGVMALLALARAPELAVVPLLSKILGARQP